MDVPASAFEMYQKQNKKKRKAPPEHKEDSKLTLHLKKQKRGEKQHKSSNKKRLGNLPEQNSILKKKKAKAVSKKYKVTTKIANGDVSSEEEIPTLIPIADFNRSEEPESKRFKKDRVQVIKTVKNPTNAKPSTTSVNGKVISVGKAKKQSKKVKNTTRGTSSDASEVSVFNPITQGLAIFKWLIDPISPKEFFEKYWEKDVLHVKRSDRKYFDDVFSSEKLDNILREYPLHFTRNVDVVTYQNGKKEVMDEEGRALPSKLWDFYNNGCSVRILNPQTYDQNVHSIISSLQEYFGTMVGTNAYLTPPDSQGFAPHFDDIEAFIVQLEGSKHWKLYKPREEDILARDSSHNFSAEDLDAPFLEVKLEAGDLLYFPRGTIHEGRTKDNEHSLHITVSVYQHTAFIDLLEQAVPAALKRAASENLEFRKGLPLNYLKHLGIVNKNDNSNKRKLIIDKVKSLVDTLFNYVDIDRAADNLGRRFMHDAMPPLYSHEEAEHSAKFDGDFMKNGRVFNRVDITPEIKVRLLRYYALRVVQESDSTSKLYFCTDNAKTYHGEEEQWLEIDNSLIPGVEKLQKQYPEFVVADSLPIKDEAEKLGLISSLWEHGLLVTDGPLPSCDSNAESDDSSVDDVLQLLESESD